MQEAGWVAALGRSRYLEGGKSLARRLHGRCSDVDDESPGGERNNVEDILRPSLDHNKQRRPNPWA